MELTNELKVERIRLQLTAKSVAEMMGISRQQLSNIEQSDNLPVMVKYIAFLRSRGVDLNDLFDRITKF
ncbi:MULTISPECIES: helix-turn-helix transcriptional regulator [Bacteroidales]|jgi:transcriptional regulator with XRE-family HTH domain|uniref:XRE family transcriptional regulator n=2 Tax=Phocaeicola TaxID=909656 RepID=A0A3E4W3H2_9BACT|nr:MULTISPECIES: helix-turn-helix transcriptional regulator [Bacteroidales]MBS4827097.1 helix-turn-helix transcriptional regulator [Bacteroides sp.]MBD8041478.1 helix-turn-helix transcriptional regulator [Phocaeicola intestinalis]MCF2599226.1 helix-turn-helix transcriptional regulator [Phocaeicola barnesiae]MCG0151560.1 helix-turn-helix domain-containing protein [Phocaeicola vulgatus]MCG0266026.1 helix-turn-helix domain-containing protein [Phocaeicola vulgatus]